MLTTKFYESLMFPTHLNCPDQPQKHICRADFRTRMLKVSLQAGHLYFTSTVPAFFPGRLRKHQFACRLSQHMLQNKHNTAFSTNNLYFVCPIFETRSTEKQ